MTQEWDRAFFQEKGQLEVATLLLWWVQGRDGIPKLFFMQEDTNDAHPQDFPATRKERQMKDF